MNLLRTLISRATAGGSRFDRYYGEVARTGVGYPTADEARRDLRSAPTSGIPFGLHR
jgi:hypothetical protein